eukprot:GHVU01211883.1.p1 GENE.GHVU01211883.1~~GHVU01211883.1.p1  ORF type:complete len:187 (+),score=17.24 GHVU01211883.1:954-1514(+)
MGEAAGLSNADDSKIFELISEANRIDLKTLREQPQDVHSLEFIMDILPIGVFKVFTNLRELVLVQQGLTSLSAFEQNNNGCLERLFASENEIESLRGLKNCVNLRLLDVSYNSISEIDSELPCECLEVLRLRGNKLTSLSGLCRAKKLQTLDVSSNRLTGFDYLIPSVETLLRLNLSGKRDKCYMI